MGAEQQKNGLTLLLSFCLEENKCLIPKDLMIPPVNNVVKYEPTFTIDIVLFVHVDAGDDEPSRDHSLVQ